MRRSIDHMLHQSLALIVAEILSIACAMCMAIGLLLIAANNQVMLGHIAIISCHGKVMSGSGYLAILNDRIKPTERAFDYRV